jgi:hypothetical protein
MGLKFRIVDPNSEGMFYFFAVYSIIIYCIQGLCLKYWDELEASLMIGLQKLFITGSHHPLQGYVAVNKILR